MDFDDPLFSPVDGFADLLVESHRLREGNRPGLIAVVAEEETLEDVTEPRMGSLILDLHQANTNRIIYEE